MKWFRNMKIGTKVTLMVALLMVVSLLVVGVISFNSASDALFDSYESSLTTQASQTAAIVSKEVQSYKADLQNTAEMLATGLDIRSALESSKQKKGYAFISYTDNGGATVSPDELKADLSGTEWYQQALAGETVITRSEVLESDGNLYFYAFSPVKEGGTVKGVITALISYEAMNSLISGIKIGKTGYATLLDKDGGVNIHPVTDKVAAKENAIEQSKSVPALVPMAELLKKCVNRETGFGQYVYSGAVKYMSYAPVDGTDWTVMLSAPKAELFTKIDQQLYAILISSAAALLVIMAALLLFVRTQVSKPLKQTEDFAKKLASGNLDANITIKSKDEVGQLSSILDGEVRQAFVEIEKNRVVSEKQISYQGDHVDKLVVNLERLSKGELYCDMSVDEADEDTKDLHDLFSRISDHLHLTVDTLRAYIEEISRSLGAMSEGDFSVVIDSEYHGDFTVLKDSINSIAESLSQVLSDINTAAEQVASGTKQVSDGSQEISQGATEQASSIEELTASVTNIAEQTKQNAANANKANELANEAKNGAAEGNEQMKGMQAAMSEINESSANISKIIKVIDDIAFQTNILALNAAVEAARAGVHGKGFAVVAEEVRNLAARSANAAKETTALIEGSIKKTEAGTKIADETAAALEGIVASVEKAVELVGEIAAASNEQATAIAQVNKGIEQMSQVVQTNSATSEQAAAAAEELSSQAELLKSMVGKFNLKRALAPKYESAVSEQEPEAATHEKPAAAPRITLNDADFGKY